MTTSNAKGRITRDAGSSNAVQESSQPQEFSVASAQQKPCLTQTRMGMWQKTIRPQ